MYLCDKQISFQFILLLHQVGARKFGALLNHDWNASHVRDNVMAVNIYFDKLEFLTVTEVESMSMIELMYSLGGLLGLCLGMSFLSLFEFLGLAYVMLAKCFSK